MNAADLFSPHESRPGIPPTRVPWGSVAVFLAIAYALGWAVSLPLWLGDGLASPLFQVFAVALMATPTIGALIVTFATVPKGARARYLGLLPFRPIGRKILLFLLWPAVFLAIAFGAMLLADALGWAEIDRSLATLTAQLDTIGMTDVELFLVTQFLALPLGVVMSSVAAFGEELGWRGYLTTALAPLGFWPSALLIGVVWGLWHAPIILLGYNFGRTDALGLVWMCVFTIIVGVLLQWSRYFTRSVWPAAIGHGALNATFAYPLFWATPDMDPLLGSAVGLPGWILMAVLILILLAARAFRPGPDWQPKRDPREA
ncbi:CPBP family intramembrane glutamic endopeptidase [Microbacterium karelineae]|uniref:CPBP family intramembrane glutamic endopeptidase n=1 Tax=Microbacterium karelineae TaxID=2654283 RepID=UPI0012EAA1C7|nr:CPBP family intramembrane glutamic endopeptidase [Microbacterium karelineae]